jgi:aryl-alcohol dehydrogenase-like predicted oxidoreductase
MKHIILPLKAAHRDAGHLITVSDCALYSLIERSKPMRYKNLGKSNMKVSRICLGTVHFANRTPEAEAITIMDRALEMGINFWDTANVYSGGGELRGASEAIIGRYFQSRPGSRDRVILATKVFGSMDDVDDPNFERGVSAYKVRKHVEDSLRRLQTDRIDLYQTHHLDRSITLEEFWGLFEKLVADGKALHMGSSNFPGWALAKYQMAAMRRGFMGFVSEQTMYNLLCRWPELEVLPAALDMGIGVIPYMPLAGGILSAKAQSEAGSRTASVENEYGIAVNSEPIKAYQALCRDLGESPIAVAIAWTLAQPAVSSAIVGIRAPSHLDEMERAAELELDTETLKRLDEVFDTNRGRPIRTGQPAPEAYAW